MTALMPMYSFEVSEERQRKAVASIQQNREKLTHEHVQNIIHELGFQECLIDDPAAPGGYRLNMTGLQLVCLAAAIAAVAEVGGRQQYNPPASAQ